MIHLNQSKLMNHLASSDVINPTNNILPGISAYTVYISTTYSSISTNNAVQNSGNQASPPKFFRPYFQSCIESYCLYTSNRNHSKGCTPYLNISTNHSYKSYIPITALPVTLPIYPTSSIDNRCTALTIDVPHR